MSEDYSHRVDLERTRPIDRTTELPYYAQLKQILLEAVGDQRLPEGARLPGDHELANYYGLSRSVVRQTLTELESDGLISRQRGKGTFLARKKVSEGLANWAGGLADDAHRRGSVVRSETVNAGIVPADTRIAALLEVEESSRVVTLERVRFVDDEPWVHTTTWLPASRVPGLELEDFAEQSLYGLLRDRYELSFGRVKRSIEAALAGEATSSYLGIPASDPVLRLNSVLFDLAGRPIETFVAFHRGDRSRFDVELESDGTMTTATTLRATNGSFKEKIRVGVAE